MNSILLEKMSILYTRHKWTLRQIAEEIGKSHEYVRKALGDNIVRKKERVNIDVSEVIEMYEKYGNISKVGRELNASRQYIHWVLKENNAIKENKRIRRRQRCAQGA